MNMAKVTSQAAVEQGSSPTFESDAELRARLRGSAPLKTLVQEIAARRRLQEVEFSDEWREVLAKDLAQFDD